MAATYIDDPSKRPKIICRGYGFVSTLTKSDHGMLKKHRLVRMVGQPVEPGLSEHFIKRRQAGAHGMTELGKGKIWLPVHHPDQVART